MTVLLVEDDTDILELLQVYFETKGYDVLTSKDGVDALQKIESATPGLILLDIGLPRLNGLSVLEAVRIRSRVPIILLSALDGVDDVVKGLTSGADDYLVKPFEIRELDARIDAVMRRIRPPRDTAVLQVGSIEIDDRAKLVRVDGKTAELSPKEYQLLLLLASDAGRVFSNDEILEKIWPRASHALATDVKQYVYRLRNKIEPAGGHIKTVAGFGYLLAN